MDVITRPCGFSGEQNNTRAGFCPSNSMSFVSIIPPVLQIHTKSIYEERYSQ